MKKQTNLTSINQDTKLVRNNLTDNILTNLNRANTEGKPKNTFVSYRSDARCVNEFFELMTGEIVVSIDEVNMSFGLLSDIGISQEMLLAYATYLAYDKPVLGQKGEVLRKGMSYGSIWRRVMFISSLHKDNNYPSPYTNSIKKYLKRLKSIMVQDGKHVHAQQAKKANVIDIKKGVNDVLLEGKRKLKELKDKDLDEKTHLIRSNKIKLTALRDRTMLLVCFAGMFRKSELAALQFEQLEFGNRSLFIHMTDQDNKTGATYTKNIPPSENKLYCPIAAMQTYIKVNEITEGYLFYRIRNKGLDKSGNHIHKDTVGSLIKTYLGADMSGHSTRIGMAVAMYEAEIPIKIIMNNGGWKTESMLWRYIKQYDIEKYNKSVL